MNNSIPENNSASSQSDGPEKNQLVIGADVITYLTAFKYPMIMVDRIISYCSSPLSLIAERYVSANEPAFVGHFPSMKLWPGIYTIEGLRQTCFLLNILHNLDKADLLKGVTELHKRQTLQPQVDHQLCQVVLDYLQNIKISDSDLFSVKIKLLEPVFAGSLITYHCEREDYDLQGWSVKATVNERLIAKGILRIP